MSIDTNNSASTRTVVDWDDAPEGATHCLIKDSGTAWFRFKDDNSFPNTWKDGEWKNVRLPTRELTPKPKQPKQLTQAVFEGLPPEYRWAAVDIGETAHAYTDKPFIAKHSYIWSFYIGRGLMMGLEGVYDTTNWQNSLIERQDVPTAADIDWSKAPEGATHYSKRFGEYYKAEDGFLLNYLADESRWIVLIDWSISALESPHFEMIKLPESIHDVARSIEAARVAEQSDRTYPHYFKDVSGVDAIDLYHVAKLYEINDPALFHAFKKIACAGKRGAKDQAQDVQEAIDALKRWQELNK